METFKPHGCTLRVDVHHIRPYGTSKGRKTRQPINVNLYNHVLRNRETLNAPDRLTY